MKSKISYQALQITSCLTTEPLPTLWKDRPQNLTQPCWAGNSGNQEKALTLSVFLGSTGPPCRGILSPSALLSLLPSLSAPHSTTKASSTCLLTYSFSTPYSGETPRQMVENSTKEDTLMSSPRAAVQPVTYNLSGPPRSHM